VVPHLSLRSPHLDLAQGDGVGAVEAQVVKRPGREKLAVSGLIGDAEGMYSSSAAPTIVAYAFSSARCEAPSAKREVMCCTKA
jgi:hypothetical protein